MNILRDDEFESIIYLSTKNCSEVELKLIRVKKSQGIGKLECCPDQPHGTLKNIYRMMIGFRRSNNKSTSWKDRDREWCNR